VIGVLFVLEEQSRLADLFFSETTGHILRVQEQPLGWFKKISKMADLEAVLADVSYLMAMEKSKSTPAARASKKIVLPDPR
jgi:hypothetical protein